MEANHGIKRTLNELLDERGIEYKLALENYADELFPKYLNLITSQLKLTDWVNDLEEMDINIIQLLKACYKFGVYTGVTFSLNDHDEIDKHNTMIPIM